MKFARLSGMAKKMTPADVTKCVLMRCRGATYREIAESVGFCAMTINRHLNPAMKVRAYARSEAWRKNNPPDYKKAYQNNRKNRLKSVSQHYQKNKKRINNRQSTQRIGRKKVDPSFRIACNLRSRLSKVVAREFKRGSAVKDLGCSLPKLKLWLEMQFTPGMTWKNYGEWHIDHVRPLASFDLTIRSEFLQACHFSNLQPLWALDNLSKGCRV